MKTFGRICLVFALITIGCSSSSGGSSSGGTSSGNTSSSSGNTSGGTSGNSGGGSCTGEITACTVASLSNAQKGDFCSLLLSSIDAKPGDKFQCNSGPNSGSFITINSKDDCEATTLASSCPIKVGQEIDCYKAVKADTCAAFDQQKGACAFLFDDATLKACKP